MSEVSKSKPSTRDRLRISWRKTRLWLLFAGGILGTIIAINIPFSSETSSILLNVGDVSPQEILAPYAYSYASEVLTEQARQEAVDAVPNYYDPPDSQVARQQLEGLQAALVVIDSDRVELQESQTPRDEIVEELTNLEILQLDEDTAGILLDLLDNRWNAIRQEAESVLQQVMRDEIRDDRLDEARRTIPAFVGISTTLTPGETDLVIELVTNFVAPNALYNDAATQAARDTARQSVAPVVNSYATGETIIDSGEVVKPLHIEALQAYGLLKPPNRIQDIALISLLVVLLSIALALFTYRVHQAEIRQPRITATLSGFLVIWALAMKAMIPSTGVLPYVFPAATLPILMSVLFSNGLGVTTALVTGVIASYLGSRGHELALYVILSGTLGALTVGKADRLRAFLWAGLAASTAAVAVIIIFRVPDPATNALGKVTLVGAGIASGMLSAALSMGLLQPLGSLLGVITTMQLYELARPDHPILQLLLRNAPGTYQHSLQVANLAEQAAREIGANPLLTRVGALYHDAGKAVRPQFYIENQLPDQNVHEQLDPTTSAGIILSHVQEGLDLARKHRLPPIIQNFISEHHGSMRANYQYRAALDSVQGDDSKLDARDFTYPGPRPQSRETALLMLADGVEAKTRADTPEDEEALDELVHAVIKDRLDRGQLDNTELTLRDLETIRHSFVNTLKGIHHPRIRYPSAEDDSQQDAQASKPLSPPTPQEQ
jgi:putative nucleotidyltransferase with HDIG domain